MSFDVDEFPTRSTNAVPTQAWLRALERTAHIGEQPARILPSVIEEVAGKFGDAPALLSQHQNLSYRDLAQAANRYSRWALEQGVRVGDCVCLMMPNRPEFVAIWLGISRIGGIVALLNTSLRGASLAHCVGAARPRLAIVDSTLSAQFAGAVSPTESGISSWVYGAHVPGFARIEPALLRHCADALGSFERPAVTTSDPALYIYTSGTTGLPKAANVSHHRIMTWSHWFAGMLDVRPSDRMYNCLPMYHSIGGVVAIGAVLVAGGSVLLRERFSASQFWCDVTDHGCTLFQYIGELCRYLVNAPRHPRETQHQLRLCCGNGLRADAWEQFVERFKIPQVVEFYAATENNFSLFNCHGKPGAIGKIPSFLAHRFNIALVRTDAEGGEPLRDANGMCVRCAPNEPGEALGQIHSGSTAQGSRFEGYTDQAASEKKLLRDVFAKGDLWLRSGDLMKKDEKGFFYFVDRLGDTFRWKGENVATSEVSNVLLAFPGVLDVAVYGVAVPGTEGKAGMATIVAGAGFDLQALHRYLTVRLPTYARPVFVRIRSVLEVTDTFKHKKQTLAREGFDPRSSEDAIYFSDPERQEFVAMTVELHARISARELRC
ncbi:MAG: long-chain-acyl-CoA synthetase [Hyphomicrobiaceae bacterium]|nr:long-chain-acyl-CoA synthetase [Hyphomicrobiaceae bacterium]